MVSRRVKCPCKGGASGAAIVRTRDRRHGLRERLRPNWERLRPSPSEPVGGCPVGTVAADRTRGGCACHRRRERKGGRRETFGRHMKRNGRGVKQTANCCPVGTVAPVGRISEPEPNHAEPVGGCPVALTVPEPVGRLSEPVAVRTRRKIGTPRTRPRPNPSAADRDGERVRLSA